MKKILITRKLIKSSEEYAASIFDVKLNKEDRVLTKDEVISQSNDCDGIISTVTEDLDKEIISRLSKNIKIISNFGVGFSNIDINAAIIFGSNNAPGRGGAAVIIKLNIDMNINIDGNDNDYKNYYNNTGNNEETQFFDCLSCVFLNTCVSRSDATL